MNEPRASRYLTRKGLLLLAGALLTLLVLAGLYLQPRPAGPGKDATPRPNPKPSEQTKAEVQTGLSPGDPLHLAHEQLIRLTAEAGSAPEERLACLHTLFRSLDRLPMEECRRRLRLFFASGLDAPTQLPFTIGLGGWLSSWPSLRCALLDYAGRVDPALAAELSAHIYATSPAPDEWAIALRDEARRSSREADADLLTLHLKTFLSRADWASNPTRGYLEAFDVPVAGKRVELLPELAALAAEDQPRPTQFAAFLALDRLMIAAPVETLGALVQNPGLLASKPELRASLVSRADPRNEQEMVQLESYLDRKDLSAAEMNRFAELFPNLNQTVSNNLLSSQPSQHLTEMRAIDQAALGRLQAWQTNSRFTSWHSVLTKTEARIRAGLAGQPGSP